MRAIDTLLARYEESHRNPTNEVIHFICIPAIVFTLLGLIWAVHWVLAVAVVVAALAYYVKLSPRFAAGMALLSAIMLAILALLPPVVILPLSIAIFVLAWTGQFVGHKIEGKKPSFFEDLRFLLIGPLFVLSFLYRRMHISY